MYKSDYRGVDIKFKISVTLLQKETERRKKQKKETKVVRVLRKTKEGEREKE